jgi:hypothetical protein
MIQSVGSNCGLEFEKGWKLLICVHNKASSIAALCGRFPCKEGNDTITSFRTDDQGWLRVSLAVGQYTISSKDWERRLGSYGPSEVDVAAGQIKKVQWNWDTGMR